MPIWRSRYQRGIEDLDPSEDHQRIVHLLGCFEFPWDMTRSLELALLRTFCAPAVSQLLEQTREFLDRPQKRYDDTDIIVSELIEYGYENERGKAALQRMNQIHSRFQIANEDYLYVLSTFIYEPIRWIDRCGWRKLTENERLALYCFWSEIGRRMGIRDIPEDYAALEQYNQNYEAQNFVFQESNQHIALSTLKMMIGWFPFVVRPIVRTSMLAMLDETMCRSFGFKRPNAIWRLVIAQSLCLRGMCLRILPGRRRPRMRTAGVHRTYPSGYNIKDIGPEK